jgi:hypothetical protein
MAPWIWRRPQQGKRALTAMVSCLALLHRTHAPWGQAGGLRHTACGLGISIRDVDVDLFAVDPESASCEQCQLALVAHRAARPSEAPGLDPKEPLED